MLVNADFTRRVIVTPADYRWVPSPSPGVERVMLDRVGEEQARATSIVRYAAGSAFPEHRHPGGEEVLVLSGTFSDERADHPAGWYLRNPPGSAHSPASGPGTMIFVKLWQMRPDEDRTVRIDTGDPAAWQGEPGRETCPLFANDAERVSLRRLGPGDPLPEPRDGGAELLVLAGEIAVDGVRCETGSWIRLPAGDRPRIGAGAAGATVYHKEWTGVPWVPATACD